MEVPAHFRKDISDDSLGEYEVCIEPDCLNWIELQIAYEHGSRELVTLADAARGAFIKLGWTGERNRMRCPNHKIT